MVVAASLGRHDQNSGRLTRDGWTGALHSVLVTISRRGFLGRTAALAAAGSIPLSMVFRGRAAQASGFGELVADPHGILDLPEGFSYTVVECAFGDMDDGYRVPGRPDGMACFAGPDGTYILLRNHEVGGVQPPSPAVGDLLPLDPVADRRMGFGHADIHYHQVIFVFFDLFHALLSIGSLIYLIPLVFQFHCIEFSLMLFIFYDQYFAHL